ncbi:MAG: hypothetical protein ACOYOZ_17220, partial [Pirellula sp.]
RGYSKIHVICDNASFHKSKDVWHLHETITRNHRCKTMEELTSLAIEWLRHNNNYYADMRNTFALAV